MGRSVESERTAPCIRCSDFFGPINIVVPAHWFNFNEETGFVQLCSPKAKVMQPRQNK